jgi:hypothetical protein
MGMQVPELKIEFFEDTENYKFLPNILQPKALKFNLA